MKSDEVRDGDCRHDCDHEESDQEDPVESDHVQMTTMTTVLHRDLENDWSSSHCSTVQCVCVQGVLWSLHCVPTSSLIGLYDPVLVSVVTPLLNNSYVILPFQRFCVKLFHVGLRVSLCVHAHLTLLVHEEALHVRSATVFLLEIEATPCLFALL